jgi:hypothetical protein
MRGASSTVIEITGSANDANRGRKTIDGSEVRRGLGRDAGRAVGGTVKFCRVQNRVALGWTQFEGHEHRRLSIVKRDSVSRVLWQGQM